MITSLHSFTRGSARKEREAQFAHYRQQHINWKELDEGILNCYVKWVQDGFSMPELEIGESLTPGGTTTS